MYADCAAIGGAAWLTIIAKSKADHAHDRGSEGQAIPTINAESATGEGLSNSKRSDKKMMKPVQTHRLASAEGRGGISPLKGDNPPPLDAPRTPYQTSFVRHCTNSWKPSGEYSKAIITPNDWLRDERG